MSIRKIPNERFTNVVYLFVCDAQMSKCGCYINH